MSDDSLIRLANLRALSKTPAQLSERVGGRYTYWRDMLKGEKSFGEKVARKIEEAYGLPRGYMDNPHERGKVMTAAEPAARYGVPTAQDATPTGMRLSKRATILAMMFDELESEEEQDRCYILCQQIMLGFDPGEHPAGAPAKREPSKTR